MTTAEAHAIIDRAHITDAHKGTLKRRWAENAHGIGITLFGLRKRQVKSWPPSRHAVTFGSLFSGIGAGRLDPHGARGFAPGPRTIQNRRNTPWPHRSNVISPSTENRFARRRSVFGAPGSETCGFASLAAGRRLVRAMWRSIYWKRVRLVRGGCPS